MIHPLHRRAEPAAQPHRTDIARTTGANVPRSSFADLFEHATAPAAATPAATKLAAATPAAIDPAPPKATTMPTPHFEDVRVYGLDGSVSSSNPLEFATAGTADAMAAKLGGKVQDAVMAGEFYRTAPERLIVGAGANPLNAGLVADLFQKYGDAPGSQAWKVINRDLGRPEMSTKPIVTT